MHEPQDFKEFAKFLAIISGKIITRYYRKNVSVEIKPDSSPVTIADKTAEEKMRELIMKEFPEHGIIGEEFGEINPDAEYKWILDPIDGTKSFICGVPTFGTLIALQKNGLPLLGAFNQPVLNEFLFGDNNICELNGSMTTVRDKDNLSAAVLLTTDHLSVEKHRNMGKFEHLIREVRLYRTWGDCFGYYLIATGFADIMIDPIMSVWDSAAVIPIIKGAGGVVTDYRGNDPAAGSSIIAAVPSLHKKVVELLN